MMEWLSLIRSQYIFEGGIFVALRKRLDHENVCDYGMVFMMGLEDGLGCGGRGGGEGVLRIYPETKFGCKQTVLKHGFWKTTYDMSLLVVMT